MGNKEEIITLVRGKMKVKYKDVEFDGEIQECIKMLEYLIQIGFNEE